jgi:dimethylargininase
MPCASERVPSSILIVSRERSNAAGIAQLRELLAPHGYTVQGVATHDCLHLKSAVTQVAADTLLVQPAWVDAGIFASYRLIEVDPGEEHAANALRIGESAVIHPDCFPRTQQRLRDAGIAVTCVDVSELQKAEGAVTCCSLVFDEL